MNKSSNIPETKKKAFYVRELQKLQYYLPTLNIGLTLLF